jgi:putative ABC transport system permease protein
MLLSIEPKEIYKSITQHKLRNALTGFGIAWGIFIMMLMMGFGDSFQQGVFKLFSSFAENTIVVWGGESTMPYNGVMDNKTIVFDQDILRQFKTAFDEIEYISLQANSPQSMQMTYNDNKNTGSLIGVEADFFRIRKQKIKAGRLFISKDFKEDGAVCIIPERVEELLFKRKSKVIGEYINIGDNYFKVIGVTKDNPNINFGDRNSVVIPFSSYQTLFNANTSNSFIISLYKDVDGSKFMKRFEAFMSRLYRVNPDDKEAFYTFSMSEQVKEFQSLFTGIRIFIWFVGFCILLTGIISVGNIMYVNINERTREIGIRKAIGATPRNILEMVLAESVVLTSIAGFVGIFFGYIVIFVIQIVIASMVEDNMFLGNIGVNFPVILTSLSILILAGVVAGILPALKASRIRPVIALNQEN